MAAPDDPPIVTLHRLPANPTPTTATTAVAPPVTWAVERRPPAAAPVPVPTTTPSRRAEIPPGASVWQVRTGDCFWTIAQSVLATRLARPVTEREIVPYWQRLIAANRARLRDTDNPDLIFPGQSFVLPL
jgi:nucleoid-associated protein YgaU